jgi:preprotein translocase subunit SecG
MRDAIIVIDILAALGLIGLVLLQQGKGADMGAGFGSGASQTLFGSRGSANFLTRTTAVLAAVFFAANMALAYLSTRAPQVGSVTQSVTTQVPESTATDAKDKKDADPSTAPSSVPDVPK